MLELTEQERKLLRLGLDPGAQPGEIQGSAAKLFSSFRRRGVSADQLEQALTGSNGQQIEPPKPSRPDYGRCVMPFRKSKYYGQMFMDIPPGALRNTLRWIQEEPDRAQKFSQLAFEITEFFKQAQSSF